MKSYGIDELGSARDYGVDKFGSECPFDVGDLVVCVRDIYQYACVGDCFHVAHVRLSKDRRWRMYFDTAIYSHKTSFACDINAFILTHPGSQETYPRRGPEPEASKVAAGMRQQFFPNHKEPFPKRQQSLRDDQVLFDYRRTKRPVFFKCQNPTTERSTKMTYYIAVKHTTNDASVEDGVLETLSDVVAGFYHTKNLPGSYASNDLPKLKSMIEREIAADPNVKFLIFTGLTIAESPLPTTPPVRYRGA